jgi:hypothetical protein
MRAALFTLILALINIALMLQQYGLGRYRGALFSAFAAGFCSGIAGALVIFGVVLARRKGA